jgi:isopenicillin-N epimerase
MSASTSSNLRELFLLDPSIHFLNHGSFGACPIPVFNAYQEWQRRLERQPVRFLGREINQLNLQARTALASYLNTSASNLVFVPNVTHGVNIISRSLEFGPGDEVLTTDQEYGACDYTWEFICKKTGAAYVRQPIHIPLKSADEIVERFWQGVTPRTRLIYISHITSPTAMQLPVETLCTRARQAGILTLVDGAHTPGQIPLDLTAIDADFYTGNCHKWMLSPKGAGFLYVKEEIQELVEPLVVSWGYHATSSTTTGSRFLDAFAWSGTQDPAAYLSVPAAIQFMQENDWDQVRQNCHKLLRSAIQNICNLVKQEPLYPLDSDFYHQMAIAPLPPLTDIVSLQKQLYEKYRVEVPLIDWNGHKFVRISVQGYNTPADLKALTNGLEEILSEYEQ